MTIAAAAVYTAIAGIALVVAGVYADDTPWALVITFLATSAGIAMVTAVILRPLLAGVHDATMAAEAMAAGDFGARARSAAGETAPLSAALNAAAARAGSTIASLRQERAQLEALLNASSDATLAVDRDGAVVYLNDAARQMFAASGAAQEGRAFIEAVRDHDLSGLVTAAAREGERSVRVVAYGPAQRWLQATAVPIEGAGAWAALAIFHDLTEVRRLEGMRRDFISNVSHELRTPLAGIRAAAETLQEGAIDDRPAAIEFMGHIQHEVDRMTQMVEELLELSRIESGAAPLRPAEVDAARLLQDTVRRFAQQAERAHLVLTAETPLEPVSLIADASRLDQALGNLVANAIKFTPEGGSITLRAEERGDDVVLSVRDTGAGIEPDQVERVFERFYKADRGRGDGGTGLGLAIVKHIARAHGGTVGVESRPGRGSTFTILLPRR